MLNNNFKKNSPTSGKFDDPFDKKKLAEEAKQDQVQIRKAINQRERDKLLLQIENDRREFDRLGRDLMIKESKLADLKERAEKAKRELFLIEGQIKQKKGGVNYLRDEMAVHENKEMSHQADLASLEQQISRLEGELTKLTTEADALKKELVQVEAGIARKTGEKKDLEQAHKSLEQDSKQVGNSKFQVAKNVSAQESEIKKNEQGIFLQKRIIDGLERDMQMLGLDITRLTRDKEAKKREIDELERKKSLIKD